ncbi:chaperonin CPN60-2, mitochondrial-like [Citrus clementina]|uniref:chaperonin CPN60-2, mitochondrial-like n=1 Tax=Citrus clementina TaxID=85681 RepID=UPI000CED114A|nr:chaperonin CPN60-2, mitochondrial-like [Citrus x clementina]
MARAMYGNGFKALLAGANANDLINGIHLAKNAVEKHLQWRARVLRSAEEIVQVGTTAANGDRKIGQVVAKAMGRFGNERLFIVSEGRKSNNELEFVKGMKLDWGHISPYFITNKKMETCVLKNPFILIYEGEISNEDICRAIASTSFSRRPLVIIARNVDEAEAGSLMLDWNYVGSKVCIIKPPTSQETTTAIMQDIAILTGGKVRASHNETAILGGFGSQAKIKERCEEFKSKINESKEDCEVKFARERLAKLSRNLAVFKVGGASKAGVDKNYKSVQNALEAAKAATEGGTVPGGGVALLHASKELDKVQVANSDQKRGVELLQHVLRMPVYSIASTPGFDGLGVVDKLLEHGNFDLGYDPAKATLPAVLGTDLKLGSRPSYPCRYRRRKLARTPVIELEKSGLRPVFVAVDPAGVVTRHHLELVPHIPSNISRPATTAGDARNSPNDLRKFAELWNFDPPPVARVATHCHHRWIHRGRN